MATLDERERRAMARMPKWQRDMIEENEARDRAKSGIPTRKVSKQYIQQHSKPLQLESAFLSAGEEIRRANLESGLLFATKEQMIDLGIWPLMSNGNDTRIINGEQPNGFDEKKAEQILDQMEKQYGDNPFWRRPTIEQLKEFRAEGGRNRKEKPAKKKGKK